MGKKRSEIQEKEEEPKKVWSMRQKQNGSRLAEQQHLPGYQLSEDGEWYRRFGKMQEVKKDED